MRFFSIRCFKNLIGLSVCGMLIFSYGSFMEAIPDHIYVSAGETASYNFTVPVSVTLRDNEDEVLSAMSRSVEAFQGQEEAEKELAVHYTVTCRLFGVFPAKDVEVTVVMPKEVYAGGQVIGIYGKANGILVLDTSPIDAVDGLSYEPAENKVKCGDYILSVNHEEIRKKEELVEKVTAYGADDIVLGIMRGGEYIEVAVHPVPVAEDEYKIGVWVKDDMAGIGTMTYETEAGDFGALGHGIGDSSSGDLLQLESGSLYRARLTGIQKGARGNPGELEGVIYYHKESYLGKILVNSDLGIYGEISEEDWTDYALDRRLYEIAFKQEIRLGEAQILSNVSGDLKSYSIEITEIGFAEHSNKGIHFQVTDEELISLTGGIVQGMSGSPIIQDGKLIGAVTHVFVNDPLKGYGIFVETMMEQ